MKTVLFIDKSDSELWNSFLRYDFVVDEYGGGVAYELCPWYPQGMATATALPDLASIVGDEEDWRAVVVCDERRSQQPPAEDEHYDNPFDYPENYQVGPGEPLQESDRPLVRLTQMLGGFPERAAVQWPHSVFDDGRPQLSSAFELERSSLVDLSLGSLNDVAIAMEQTDDVYDLLQRYRLGVKRPSSILIVAPRERDLDVDAEKQLERELTTKRDELRRSKLVEKAHRQELDEAERAFLEARPPLGFWERNGYPASVRFLVYDLLARRGEELPLESELPLFARDAGEIETAAFAKRDEWFGFWLSVLSLVVSGIDASDIRPFALSSLTVDCDELQLNRVLSRRLSEWEGVKGVLAREIDLEEGRLAVSEVEMNEVPSCRTDITVSFDLVDEDEIRVDPKTVCLFKDRPEKDLSQWEKQRRRVEKELQVLLRAPKRGLGIAASRFRSDNALDPAELEYCALNEYQQEVILDQVREAECELAATMGRPSFDLDAVRDPDRQQDTRTRKEIRSRATRRQWVVAVAVACGVTLLGFLPFCFGLMGGAGASVGAWAITLGVCAVLVGVSLLTMLRMRHKLRNRYREYNGSLANMLSNLHKEANRLGKRLSTSAWLKKSWSILDRQGRIGEPTERGERLGRWYALLQTRTSDIARIAPAATVDYGIYNGVARGGIERVSSMLAEPSFFTICDAEPTNCTLNGGTPGERPVNAPYSFVTNIVLKMVDVR